MVNYAFFQTIYECIDGFVQDYSIYIANTLDTAVLHLIIRII